MSHLLITYSLHLGAKIGKPHVLKNFYPLSGDKYITIHNSSGMGSKNYEYFQDVVDCLLPTLEKNGIRIVQIGTKDDGPLDSCEHLHGKTSYSQTAYIIDNACLHLGNDSFPVHLASACNTPVVALFGLSMPEVSGPCFSDKEKVINLVGDLNGRKVSFNPNESPKTINTIKVEDVVDSVCKLLDVKPIFSLKSLYVGNRYTNKVIEFVPDQVVRAGFAPEFVLNMRVDYLKNEVNENLIYANLKSRKFAVCMSNNRKVKNIAIFTALKENLVEMFLDITDGEIDFEYIEALCAVGIRPKLIYKSLNVDKLNAAKVRLMDSNLQFFLRIDNKEEIDKLVKLADTQDSISIKTNRIILAENKIFLTEAHLRAGIATKLKNQDLKLGVSKEDIFKEAEFLYVYQGIQNT